MEHARNEGAEESARLALEDGSVLRGRAFGRRGLSRTGEVVFNTAMTGYQESMTDPSYRGQILVLTAPLVGNTGTNAADVESGGVQISGLVVRELTRVYSNYRAECSLDAYLDAEGVLGVEGVDTRALTRSLRSGGVMRGVVSDDASLGDRELVELARGSPAMAGRNLVGEVGGRERGLWTETLGSWRPAGRASGPGGAGTRVLAFDCGAKRNILRHLTDRGCEVVLVPADTDAEQVRGMAERGEVDGLFVSNGPGDPSAVEGTIRVLRELVGGERPVVPTFGICLGHQLLASALGAKTYKLRFGHRGLNQPVKNLITGRVEITSQNHGFAVETDSIAGFGGIATHIHLNDGTLAGFCVPGKPVFAVQHHPEASPGPHDSGYLFDAFVGMMRTGWGVDVDLLRTYAGVEPALGVARV